MYQKKYGKEEIKSISHEDDEILKYVKQGRACV